MHYQLLCQTTMEPSGQPLPRRFRNSTNSRNALHKNKSPFQSPFPTPIQIPGQSPTFAKPKKLHLTASHPITCSISPSYTSFSPLPPTPAPASPMPISPPSFSPAAFSTTPTTVSASPTSTTVVLPASPPMKQSPASGHNKRPISEKQSSSGSESSSDERESSADDQESNDDETNETSESEDKLMDEWDSSSAESSNEAEDDRRKCAPTRRAASSLPKPPATKLDKFISPKKKKATPTYDDASITIIQPKKKRLQRQMSSDSESDDAITNTRPRNKHQKPRFTNAKKSRTPSPSQEDESNDEEKKDKETSKNNRADDDVWAKNDGWDDDGKSRLKFFTHPRVLEWKLRSIPKVKTQEDGGDTGLLINWIVWCGFLTKRQQKLHTCGYGDEATGCKVRLFTNVNNLIFFLVDGQTRINARCHRFQTRC